ncbi:MAG TPA: hypothetical protein VK673_15880, partial [Chthoniobacterales bacterium]|nr:hypothetical protein [Chthoniobacterales bacterium]
ATKETEILEQESAEANSNFRLSVAARGNQFILCGLCELLFKPSVLGGITRQNEGNAVIAAQGTQRTECKKRAKDTIQDLRQAFQPCSHESLTQ